jgi:hypothetical protein
MHVEVTTNLTHVTAQGDSTKRGTRGLNVVTVEPTAIQLASLASVCFS